MPSDMVNVVLVERTPEQVIVEYPGSAVDEGADTVPHGAAPQRVYIQHRRHRPMERVRGQCPRIHACTGDAPRDARDTSRV